MYRIIALAVINNNCKRKPGLKINDGKKLPFLKQPHFGVKTRFIECLSYRALT